MTAIKGDSINSLDEIVFKDGRLPAILQKGTEVIDLKFLTSAKELEDYLNNYEIVFDCDNDAAIIKVNSGVTAFDQKVNLETLFYEPIKTVNRPMELIPVITQDQNGTVLMTAYMSKETLERTLKGIPREQLKRPEVLDELLEDKLRLVEYISRSRGKSWLKGNTSGCYQELLKIRTNKQKDCLLITVRQYGTGACDNKEQYSCFYKEVDIR